jgi:transketolase
MKKEFFDSLTRIALADPSVVFLTGDLGYGACEGLRDAIGDHRFINAGVAEQNMVGVAAGLAAAGMRPFCYSIAPFLYSRAHDQIRVDVAQHNLPVTLVGMGGGAAYGQNGPTHFALEDFACLMPLGIRCLAPAFSSDVELALASLSASKAPAYLRLGEGAEKLPGAAAAMTGPKAKAWQAWERVHEATDPECTPVVVAAVGPLVGEALTVAAKIDHVEVWAVKEWGDGFGLPEDFHEAAAFADEVIALEEHSRACGFGEWLGCYMKQSQEHQDTTFRMFGASDAGVYASQGYNRGRWGIGAEMLTAALVRR